MTTIAIVKPDHLGDLVLSIPAIRAVQRQFRTAALFASPSTRFLVRHYLPDTDFRPTALRYLQKGTEGSTLDELIDRLKSFSIVIFLREDAMMNEVVRRISALSYILRGAFETHETRTQQDNVQRVIGPYSRLGSFPEVPMRWPQRIRAVGLCVSAGFHANKWPTTLWERLGRLLVQRGAVQLRVIGGPSEERELAFLARRFGLPPAGVVSGGPDVGAFLDRVADCDVVVGADSGTLHIVSTRVPVLGLFTSSPWRRFAPFGPAHRVVSAEVACSPCIQFMSTHYNGCLTRECAMLIEPSAVADVLLSDASATSVAGLMVASDPSRSLEDGNRP